MRPTLPAARPLALLGLAACLAFPALWHRVLPRTSTQPIVRVLNAPHGLLSLGHPAAPERARLVRQQSEGAIDPNDAFPALRYRAVYEIELPQAGRYSVYGISANERAQPVELAFNGRVVRATAFWQATGSRETDFERHRLATGVRLETGVNRVDISGVELPDRTFVLELREERPLGPLRYLLLALVAGAALLAATLLARRVDPAPALRVALICVTVPTLLSGLLAGACQVAGRDLVALGHKHPLLVRRIETLERDLQSDQRGRGDDRFEVAVFGDSTHYYGLPEDEAMLPALRRELAARGAPDVRVYGISAGGMSAWDYYLLLNRVCDERPDLLVLPVNGSSFSEGWLGNQGYRFRVLERYLRFDEYPGALRLSVAGRELSLPSLLSQRLDAMLFDGRGRPFLRGLKILVEDEGSRIGEELLRRGAPGWAELPQELQGPEPDWGAHDVGEDHPLFAVFDRINRLAARCGATVLYYNVQELPLDAGGIGPITAEADMRRILGRLEQDRGAHTLRLDENRSADRYSDAWIHLTPPGMRHVAARLVEEILRIRDTAAALPPSEHQVRPDSGDQQDPQP